MKIWNFYIFLIFTTRLNTNSRIPTTTIPSFSPHPFHPLKFPKKKFLHNLSKKKRKKTCFSFKRNQNRNTNRPILSEKKERKTKKKDKENQEESLSKASSSIGFQGYTIVRVAWRRGKERANGIKPGLVIPTIQRYTYTRIPCIVQAAREGKWNRRERYAARWTSFVPGLASIDSFFPLSHIPSHLSYRPSVVDHPSLPLGTKKENSLSVHDEVKKREGGRSRIYPPRSIQKFTRLQPFVSINSTNSSSRLDGKFSPRGSKKKRKKKI